jgi:hypothetical protein
MQSRGSHDFGYISDQKLFWNLQQAIEQQRDIWQSMHPPQRGKEVMAHN